MSYNINNRDDMDFNNQFISYNTKALFKEFLESLKVDCIDQFGRPIYGIANILEAYRLHFKDIKNEDNEIFWQILASKGNERYLLYKRPWIFF
jgi:hypothetical protein